VKQAARIAVRQSFNESSNSPNGTQATLNVADILRAAGVAIPLNAASPNISVPIEVQDAIADQLVEQYWPQIQYVQAVLGVARFTGSGVDHIVYRRIGNRFPKASQSNAQVSMRCRSSPTRLQTN
jgi:hypothetical protein